MGKSIGGAIVGLISTFIVSGIIVVALGFIMGTAGMIEPETFAPTIAWTVMLLVTGGLSWFLGAAIARAIAKENLATYILVGILVLLSLIPLVSQAEPDTSKLPKPTMDMSPLMALQWSSINAPSWMQFASPLIAIGGALLGGLDRAKKSKDANVA